MTDQQEIQSTQQAPIPPVQQQAPTPPIQPAQQAQPQSLISFNTTAPEPPSIPASYQSIIDQQNEQIAALMAQNQALNGQITQMVQNGAQFTSQANTVFANGHTQQVVQPQYQHKQVQQLQQFPNYYEPANPMQQFNPPSLALDQDVSLESLAEQIGKKE